jgi:proline iminopeptidase
MRVWFTLAFALAAMLFARPSDAQQSGRIDNECVVLHYSTVGTGDPIVLLSGGPGFSSAYMAPLAALLAPDHLVIIPDLRGTGRSQPTTITSATVNSPLILDDLEALRSHLGIERWDVIGHSFGSLLGMRYALAHPGSVDRLVLLAAMAPKYSMAKFGATLDARTTP